jgi:hypothetical protein
MNRMQAEAQLRRQCGRYGHYWLPMSPKPDGLYSPEDQVQPSTPMKVCSHCGAREH